MGVWVRKGGRERRRAEWSTQTQRFKKYKILKALKPGKTRLLLVQLTR